MTANHPTATKPWYSSTAAILLASAALPPAGLVLLWLRHGTRWTRKVLGSLAIAVVAVFYLVVFFGLRLVPAGSGLPTILTFSRPEAEAEALERHRAQHRVAAAPAQPSEPAPVAAAPEEPARAAAGEPAKAPPSKPGSDYWTDFRGPHRDGRYEQAPVLTNWPSGGLPLAWKQPVGGGYASFVIAGGRAFTIEQRRENEVVAAYDLRTGRELWTSSWPAKFQESMGGDGPRATPTWHENRVYALGATGQFRCLEAGTGKLIWSRDILADAGADNLQWGMAASPLIVDDKVIVLPGGQGGKSVAAYNRLTGEPVWTAQNDKQAYASPMLVTLAGKRQLLIVSSRRVMGLTVEDGSLLWEFPWVTQYDTNSAQPVVVDENHFVVSGGYGHGSALVEIKADGAGFSARAVWENAYLKNRFNSSVLHEGHLYGLDEGILVCLDARTGDRRWKGGRYGYGQVLLASGHLFITTEDGDVVLVRATPERHTEVSRFSALNGKTWNNPAVADGLLLVRNATEMAAFRITP